MPTEFDLIITVNSPGEVAGWVTPVVKAFKSKPWKTSITVFVPPCSFASGAECRVAREIKGVDLTVDPRKTLHYLLWGKAPSGFQPSGKGAVLFLGGDMTYAALLSRRLHYPAVAYTEGLSVQKRAFSRLAVPYERMRQGMIARRVPEEKIRVVGNLMVDAVTLRTERDDLRRKLNIQEGPALLLMPGSRPGHFQYMLPFFIKAAEKIRRDSPDLSVLLSISPFISDNQVIAALFSKDAEYFGVRGSYQPGGPAKEGGSGWERPGLIRTREGLTVQSLRSYQYDLMNLSDLALTIPGTNTVELASLGTPMIATAPLAHPERIPLEGVVGLLGEIPLLGRELKRRLIPRALAKVDFLAWPNRLAGRSIVPEIRGDITPDDLARAAGELLKNQDRRKTMAVLLKEAVGPSGAALKLTEVVREVLTEEYGGRS